VTHILSDPKKKSSSAEEENTAQDQDDDAPSDQRHPWAPVWSSALFMAVMLAFGCAYMRWSEF